MEIDSPRTNPVVDWLFVIISMGILVFLVLDIISECVL